MDSTLARSSNFSPRPSRWMIFSAKGSVATRMWRAWYSFLGEAAT